MRNASAIMNKFILSLDSEVGKMSASKPDGTIYLSDNKEQVSNKIDKFIGKRSEDSIKDFSKISELVYLSIVVNYDFKKEGANVNELTESIGKFLMQHQNMKFGFCDKMDAISQKR